MPSAGQVEQFAYCAHNWFLARRGVEGNGGGSKRGIAVHRALGQEQRKAEADQEESREGLRLSLQLVLLAAALTLLVLVALDTDLAVRRQVTLAVLALVLVSGSAALFTIGILAQRRYRARQRAAHIPPGRLLSSDLAGQAPLLTDAAWDLSGRPDYLLSTKDGAIPVEVKTGRTPPHPYPSHALQVACYLRLLEAQEGRPPPYGMLQYPDGFFRVEWNDALRADLRTTLDRMRAAEAAGRADRDHDQPGRCRGCARRNACDQRLDTA